MERRREIKIIVIANRKNNKSVVNFDETNVVKILFVFCIVLKKSY